MSSRTPAKTKRAALMSPKSTATKGGWSGPKMCDFASSWQPNLLNTDATMSTAFLPGVNT